MEYIKNNKGILKTIIVKEGEKNFESLKKLSLDEKVKVYLLPKVTKIELDDNGWLISVDGNPQGIWQFIKGWPMPYECFVNGFPFPIKMEDMWYSDVKVEDVKVEELEWNLDIHWWNKEKGSFYDLTPNAFIENTKLYPEHDERTEKADLKYPLLLIQTKQNRWLIYDGVHRFVKGILKGEKSFLCQKFQIEDMDKYIPEGYEELFNGWKEVEYIK